MDGDGRYVTGRLMVVWLVALGLWGKEGKGRY